jgi:hypothetical protein
MHAFFCGIRQHLHFIQRHAFYPLSLNEVFVPSFLIHNMKLIPQVPEHYEQEWLGADDMTANRQDSS